LLELLSLLPLAGRAGKGLYVEILGSPKTLHIVFLSKRLCRWARPVKFILYWHKLINISVTYTILKGEEWSLKAQEQYIIKHYI
jgi:hypothetical protein